MAVTTTSARPRTERAKSKPRKSNVFTEMRRHWADYLYIAPALLVMLLVIGYPIYYTGYLSFFETPPSRPLSDKIFVGVGNYTDIIRSRDFWDVTKNTFVWSFFSTIFAFAIGFGAAIMVNRAFVGQGIIRGILLIPYVISTVAAAYVWRWLYHSDFGLISGVLLRFGLIDRQLNFLDSVDRVMPSLIIANIWKEFPFAMIMMLAGLQTVPEQLLRAAQIDGAGIWDRFWHVTVPHLKGVIVITTLLLLIANLNAFAIVDIMTGGGPAGASQIWITEIYERAFRRIRFGEAASYSVILSLVMLSMGYFYVKAMTRGDDRRRG